MEMAALKFIGAGLTALGMLGAAIGVGLVGAAVLLGIARNPSAENKLQKYFFIAAGLSEAMGILAFAVAMILIFVV